MNLVPEYTVTLEFLWFGVIAHTTLNVPYSKDIKRKYRSDLQLIASSLSLPLYAFHAPSHDERKRKFIQRVGFAFDHFRFTEDGEKAEMFRFRPLD